MDNNNHSGASAGGLGIGTILFIVFLILKLTGVIDWSWWLVTAPLWIPIGIVCICLIILGIIYFYNN